MATTDIPSIPVRPARWTRDDDAALRSWYAAGVPVAEIARRLGRSPDAVGARRRALGLAARRAERVWTDEQDVLLRASAGAGVPARLVAERLGLPLEAVRRRRRALAPRAPAGRPYARHEDDLLRAAVARGAPLRELAARLERSEGALRLRARALGLTRPRPRPRWSGEEDDRLREGYEAGLTCSAIAARLLPHRTAGAIVARARKLGLATYGRAWTAADDERLRRLAAGGAAAEVAGEALGRSPEAVRIRARRLVLALDPAAATNARRPWRAEEDRLLRELGTLDLGRLARLLGRSDRAVRDRLRALGMRDGRERSPHRQPPARRRLTPGEERLVARELRPGGGRALLALAARLRRDPAELATLARTLPAPTRLSTENGGTG